MWQEERESEGVGRRIVVWSLSLPLAAAVSLAPLLKGEHAAPRPVIFSAALPVPPSLRRATGRVGGGRCCEAGARLSTERPLHQPDPPVAPLSPHPHSRARSRTSCLNAAASIGCLRASAFTTWSSIARLTTSAMASDSETNLPDPFGDDGEATDAIAATNSPPADQNDDDDEDDVVTGRRTTSAGGAAASDEDLNDDEPPLDDDDDLFGDGGDDDEEVEQAPYVGIPHLLLPWTLTGMQGGAHPRR